MLKMPAIIDIPTEIGCSLAQAADALATSNFDPRDEDSTRNAAYWLKRLNNNQSFLGDLLLERLKAQGKATIESGYGPQAIILSPMRGRMFLRANIWPSESDLCFKNSGSQTFVYGVPHDHNFSFLTSGYLGPGYRSDYYTYEYDDVAGFPGERANLHFEGRSQLSQGKLMLYRAHLDVHSQLPPESLSVSLNVMHVDAAQCWYDQYGFDTEADEVSRVLSPNATEVFLRTAVASGSEEALDYAQWVGATHPSERLRLASFEARAGRLSDVRERDDLWREAERGGSRMVAAIANDQRRYFAKV